MRSIGLGRGTAAGWRLGLAVAAACGLVTGCTALLGSYEVDPSVGGTPDGGGGADGDVPPVPDAADDGPADGASGLPYQCAPQGPISDIPAPGLELVAAWRAGERVALVERPISGATATTRSFVPGQGASLTAGDPLPDFERALEVRRVNDGIAMLYVGGGASRAVYFGGVPDNLQRPTGIRTGLTVPSASEVRGTFRTTGQGPMIVLWERVGPTEASIVAGRLPPDARPFEKLSDTGAAAVALAPQDLLVTASGNQGFLFDSVSPEPALPQRTAGMKVFSTDPQITPQGGVIPLSRGTGVKMLAAGEAANGGFRLATASLRGADLASARVDLRVGQVTPVELLAFDAAKLPALEIGAVADLPFDRGTYRWLGAGGGADFVFAGPVPSAPGGVRDAGAPSRGVGFVWGSMVNGTFELRATHVGAGALFPGETGVQWVHVDRAAPDTATESRFDVVFGDANGGGRVKHAVVRCAKR